LVDVGSLGYCATEIPKSILFLFLLCL